MGTMTLYTNHSNSRNTMICPMKVAFSSNIAGLRCEDGHSQSMMNQRRQRIGQSEIHRHPNSDEEIAVDEPEQQKHPRLQHGDELGLAPGCLEELRAHDADADTRSAGTEPDDQPDADRGIGLKGCYWVH